MNYIADWFWLNVSSLVVGFAAMAIVGVCLGVRKLAVWGGKQVVALFSRKRDQDDLAVQSRRLAHLLQGQIDAQDHGLTLPSKPFRMTEAAVAASQARDPFAAWDGQRFVPSVGATPAQSIQKRLDELGNQTATGRVGEQALWEANRLPLADWSPEVAKVARTHAMVRETPWRGTGGARNAETGKEPTWLAGISFALLASLVLSACNSTPAQQATLVNAGLTLAAIAAQNNTTVASVVTKGALFCQLGGGAGIVAVINAAGAPVSVTGQSAAAVATACGAFQAIPVPPPSDPASVPTQALPTLPAVKS